VGGVWKPWKRSGTVYYNPEKVWNTRTFNLNSFILPGATDIQLAIFVRDLCPLVCGSWGSGACHSHGPLIDNVRLIDGNTPPGYFVDVVPVDPFTGTSPVSLEFFQVTGSGETSLHMSTGGPVPNGFAIGDGTYYNISTTATVTGGIDVCITYNEAALTVPEASLQMMHWDEQLNPDSWVNITTTLDVVNNKICGWTENLSPFVIAKLGPTPVDGTPSPQAFALRQNVPNPFNPTTTITYDVPAGGAKVSIRVYDAAGRLVRALVEEQRPAGTHATTWDGRDQFGSQVSSGVYFYRMTAGSFVESRRMVLLK
jgi:hypothetical protein